MRHERGNADWELSPDTAVGLSWLCENHPAALYTYTQIRTSYKTRLN